MGRVPGGGAGELSGGRGVSWGLARYNPAMLALLLLACTTSEAPAPAGADSTADDTATVDSGAADTAPQDTTAGDTAGPADTDPGDTADTGPADTGPADTGAAFVDFRDVGPVPFVTAEGAFTTTSGCTLAYVSALPASWTTLVVLLHGLERESEQQREAAEHLAGWGLAVVAPTSCHARVTDLDQAANAADAIELAAAFGATAIVYAGHSAGGLAAFRAAADDPAAIAFLGLDPTEWDGIGADAAPRVAVPAYAALGAPGVCNLDNNFAPVLQDVPGSRMLRVTEADHCDFEWPTDWVCTVPCGTEPNDLFSDAEIYDNVLGLATAFAVWQAGLDASGAGWWEEDGDGYALLNGAGAITEP